MRISTHTNVTHTLTLDDGIELELEYKPTEYGDDPLVERIGENVIVVGYLADDGDGGSSNPMENSDCQGNIYTRRRHYGGGSITDDDREVYRALGLDSGGGIDIDIEFAFEPHLGWNGTLFTTTTLRDLGAAVVFNEIEADLEGQFEDWLDNQDLELDEGETLEQAFSQLAPQLFRDLVDQNSYFWEEVQKAAEDLYPEYWERIAGPYVVPISYNSERCQTSIGPTTWDGDVDNLPDGVWVADKGAEQNISDGYPAGIGTRFIAGGSPVWHRPSQGVQPTKEQLQAGYHVVLDDGVSVAIFDLGTGHSIINYIINSNYGHRPGDVAAAARDYAAGVLSEYEMWCNGEVFGVVTQVFELKPDESDGWQPCGVESCWGFIGHDYAKVSLQHDYFRPLVDSVRKRAGVATT